MIQDRAGLHTQYSEHDITAKRLSAHSTRSLFMPTLSALDPSYTPLEELWHRSFLVTPIIDKVLGRECRGILQGQLANSDHHHCTYTVTLRYP